MPVDWSMLPNDVVRLVMRRHWILYRERENAIRRAHRACVRELEETFCAVRMRYYQELMDYEGGGYGYMLDDEEIEAELDEYPIWDRRAVFAMIRSREFLAV